MNKVKITVENYGPKRVNDKIINSVVKKLEKMPFVVESKKEKDDRTGTTRTKMIESFFSKWCYHSSRKDNDVKIKFSRSIDGLIKEEKVGVESVLAHYGNTERALFTLLELYMKGCIRHGIIITYDSNTPKAKKYGTNDGEKIIKNALSFYSNLFKLSDCGITLITVFCGDYYPEK